MKIFSLPELQAATNNFSSENVIGNGGFGVVSKGHLPDGSKVAIKRLFKEKSTRKGLLQFETEVKMIGNTLHRNLLRLCGFCITSKERLLFYPYMVNGSVASRLKGCLESRAPLEWQTRKCVAYGAASALMYLHEHCHPKIIHRDVKADNILLNEDFEAVVGDFGLAKFVDLEKSHMITVVCGTIGHIAPEYFNGLRCSEKTDIYGYGVLLLELISGKRVYNIIPSSEREEGVMLFEWIEELLKEKKLELLVDCNLYGNYNYREAEDMIHIALKCTLSSPKERPLMSSVIKMLEHRGLVVRRCWERQTQLTLDLSKLVFLNLVKEHDLQDSQNAKAKLVGYGSLGSVYKATLRDGYTIAIKMLKGTSYSADNFSKYLNLMKKVKHPNIWTLEAYFCSQVHNLLVYNYASNESLHTLLHGNQDSGRKPLDWRNRINLVLQAAQGLASIHAEYNAIHGNVKSTNILIDKNNIACISNLGEYLLQKPHSEVRGVEGYSAPERKFSQEADVYSFGVLLLEVLTGKDPSRCQPVKLPDRL